MTETLPAASSSRAYDEDRHTNDKTEFESPSPTDFVRSIHIVKNGDVFNPPKRIVVNKRQIRTWEALLEELTLNLKPMHGAIRWIHTPTRGHRLHSLEEIRHEGQYIAVPFGEKLKLYGSNQSLSSKRNGARLEPLKPVEPRRNKAESRILQGPYNQRKIIHVYRNGDEFCRPIHVLLKHFEQKDMEFVLRAVDDRVVLVSSKAIRRLYTMEGKRIKNPDEIEDGRSYVAAGVERFIDCNYGHRLPNLLLGNKRERDKYEGVKFLSQRLTPPKERLSRRTPLSLNDLSQNSSGDTHKRENEAKQQQGHRSAFQKSNILTKPLKNETKKDQNMDSETAAAISIQAAYRGYAARKEMKENRPPSSSPKPPSHRRAESSPPPTTPRHQATPPSKDTRPNEKHIQRTPTPQNSTDPQDEILDDEDTAQAALKIQSNFRGYRTRRELKEKEAKAQSDKGSPEKEHPTSTEEEDAAIQIQAAVRGYQTRKHLKENQASKEKPVKEEKEKPVEKEKSKVIEKKPAEPEKMETSDDEKKAAIEIQAAYRGYSTRKKMKQLKEEENAAVAIQSAYRGYQTRRNLQEQQQAAEHIQAAYKGYLTRQSMNEQEQAALQIQAVYRGHKTRQSMHKQQQAAEQNQAANQGHETRQSMNEQEQAALQIQAVYRGYRTRRSLQEQQQAATVFQAAYNGYSTRNKMQTENAAAAVIQASYRGYKTRKEYVRSKGISTNEMSVQ